ncbi:MAG: hypothetical protein OEM79_05300 [Nitrosopumilus sp.]|nr:hypothetical protein [Nitrosopumilus sp.]
MRKWKPVMITGSVIFILGIIFHFQGKSVIGPESSFMYSNPEWVSYGIQIAVVGIIISGIGITLKFIRKI